MWPVDKTYPMILKTSILKRRLSSFWAEEKIDNQNQNNNTSNSNENQKTDNKEQNSTNDSPPPVIKLSDEDTLNMILKITFIILDFVKGALEDSNEDE